MFKDIPGYPGYMINENSIIINKSGHVFRPALNNNGRLRLALDVYDENGNKIRRDNVSPYRLAAKTFIPNPDNLPVVMHIDNDPLHCHISNLKWGTQSDNIRQAFDEGRKISPNKDNHDVYMYRVYNDDRTDVIECKGCKGVGDLIGFKSVSVHPGKILSGPYKGYNIENSRIKIKSPIKFIENHDK